MQILITGASTGIGEGCARWLDARGHRVFAGVRRPEDGDRLMTGSSARLTPVRLDVTEVASIVSALASVEAASGDAGLDGLVNNAGIAVGGPLEYVPLDGLRRQLEVNVIGQVAVTQAFLPLLRRARGRIVFMGSIGGRVATPFLAPYCASKFALEAIADALRIELQPWGMHVSMIEPGSIATPIWTKRPDGDVTADDARRPALSRDYGAALAAFRSVLTHTAQRGLPTDAVSTVVEHALTSARPRPRYVVGRDAKLQLALGTFVPARMQDWFVTRYMKLPRRASSAARRP
jgi:NAD(P)-dependent dehydrogenase (short-subunit alcohol dehydrogenase family)